MHTLPTPTAESCIGVFDSGMGGLSIVREILAELPRENVFYFADNLHLPYGPRPLDEVLHFSVNIADALLRMPCKLVVVACNTASAAALRPLRALYPDRTFVGMEPAVKPAAKGSRSGKVAVLATQATFQGALFESVVERFAHDVDVICQPCPGLAEFIEHHEPDHPAMPAMLDKFVRPVVQRGADQIVLGCTHYALVGETIAQLAGPDVAVVDPSPAIAKRVRQVLSASNLLRDHGDGGVQINVSGENTAFSRSASVYLKRELQATQEPFRWIPVDSTDKADIWSD